MEAFLEFVKEWGYIAVLLGSMVEGESVILTASALAHLGYLNIYKIMGIAFLGTLFADQALYQVGYHFGPKFFDKFPRIKPRTDKAFGLLHKWDVWFIIMFRFVYGIRTISPLVIGAAGISPKRFIPLNLLSAVIWTLISCAVGYMLGDVLEYMIENFKSIQRYLVLIPLGVLLLIAMLYTVWRKRRDRPVISTSEEKS